jgi:hypothetical protein
MLAKQIQAAYLLSYYGNCFFVLDIFNIRSQKLFAWAGLTHSPPAGMARIIGVNHPS